jgi:hypothetical protein
VKRRIAPQCPTLGAAVMEGCFTRGTISAEHSKPKIGEFD